MPKPAEGALLAIMSVSLRKALKALQQLPEDSQAALVERFQDMVARARIDAKLAESEARGGETASDTFFAELRAEFGG